MKTSIKTSAIALAAVIGLGAIATPVLAEGSKLFDGDYYITQLRYDGVNAIAADEVTGSTFRATVLTADGHQTYEFFDRDSLQPIKR
jgi:hypothetical protein